MAETAADRKISVGKQVTVEGRGDLGQGKVTAIDNAGRGEYVEVTFGSKKDRQTVLRFRPSKLTRWK